MTTVVDTRPLESRPAKRVRVSGQDGQTDPGAKKPKQRGRPRVDTQDETAAERRRTQIRLAQRAYRQRKESTIAHLEKEVSDLHSAIEEMNAAFLQFNDFALASGVLSVRPELARELKKTTETFVRLAKVYSASAGENDTEEVALSPSDHSPVDAPRTFIQDQEVNLATTSAITTTPETVPKLPAEAIDLNWLNSRVYSEPEPSPYFPSVSMPTRTSSNPQPLRRHAGILPFGIVDLTDSSASPTPQPELDFPLEVPECILPFSKTMARPWELENAYTYSVNETTFARRLQRAAIERGYHLLSTNLISPRSFKKTFGLTSLFTTRENLVSRFRAILRRANTETLDFYSVPFIHLGGAGTHYPQRDEHGNIIIKPNSWNVRSIGPYRRLRLESASNSEILSPEYEIDLTGFEGEWFDSQDAEGYLAERNLHINPQDSFAEVEVLDVGQDGFSWSWPPIHNPQHSQTRTANDRATSSSPGSTGPVTNTSSPHSNLESPRTPSLSDVHLGGPSLIRDGFDWSGLTELTRGGEQLMDIDDIQAQALANQLLAFGGPPSPQIPRKRVTIDVNALVEQLICRCVCLGRSPGFRRRDVDRAIDIAMLKSY